MTTSEARRWKDSPDPSVRAEAERVLSARKRRRERSRPSREAREAKRESKSQVRREVREACVRRSGGRCEQCGSGIGRRGQYGHLDHFWGRSREESVESCWMLCVGCDDDKTNNRPNRAEWLLAFGIHAKGHDYGEQVAKVEAAIGLERAQHPEAR